MCLRHGSEKFLSDQRTRIHTHTHTPQDLNSPKGKKRGDYMSIFEESQTVLPWGFHHPQRHSVFRLKGSFSKKVVVVVRLELSSPITKLNYCSKSYPCFLVVFYSEQRNQSCAWKRAKVWISSKAPRVRFTGFPASMTLKDKSTPRGSGFHHQLCPN